MSFGFIISTCITSKLQYDQLSRCINSIRTHHKENYILIINDTKNKLEYNIKELFENDNKIIIVSSINQGSGELQSFYFFQKQNYFDTAVILHDSMILLEALDNIKDINIKFIWYFSNHITQWDIINEPITNYNIENNIRTHTDLLQDCILSDFRDNVQFQKFSLHCLKDKKKWVGCFGTCCIINKETLQRIENIVPFIKTFTQYTNKRYRCAAESIFALICHFIYNHIDFTKSYDGLYYDGSNENKFHNKPCEFDNNLKWYAKNKYIGKFSFNR